VEGPSLDREGPLEDPCLDREGPSPCLECSSTREDTAGFRRGLKHPGYFWEPG